MVDAWGTTREHCGENGGKPMTTVQLKREITSLLDVLPEPKLTVVFDFVQFLAERDLQAAWISAQSQSAAYQEWTGSDNNIYDEVFDDTERMATLFGRADGGEPWRA
jgi:hypothetical protein